MRRFPVPRSDVILGLDWLGLQIPYPEHEIRGDTFPMTWAKDGEIYTSSGDPWWGQSIWGLDVEKFSGMAPDYQITKVHDMEDFTGWGGDGPKPCGMISVQGVLYLAVHNLGGHKPPLYGTKSQCGADAVIFASHDCGQTWTPNVQLIFDHFMFKGPRFGGPSFINFGQDNANARDEFVYAVSTDQWDNGSQLRLGRVPQDLIQNASAWQWVAEVDEHTGPVWTSDLNQAHAILSDDCWISLSDMVYLKGINRYLLLTWRMNEDFSNKDGTRLIIYDAPEPWGPFTLVHYEPVWETKEMNPYCPRLPLKWLEPDGLTGWLQFSGAWSDYGLQKEPYYRSHVRRFRLRMR